MATHVIVVENRSDWTADLPDQLVVTAADYIAGKHYAGTRGIKVINLCRSYRYLSLGYYCSLLAEARRHRVIPSVRTVLELSRKPIYELAAEDFDDSLQRLLRRREELSLSLTILLGHCADPAFRELARQLFELFPCPMLRVELRRDNKRWRLHRIRAQQLTSLSRSERELLQDALSVYLGRRWRSPPARTPARYDLAILQDPEEKLPPSNRRALQAFVRAGKHLGVDVELIGRRDFSRLPEFDALFIRETTRIGDHTFRFARKAEAEGMVVIDDPDSILRCTNKVFLAELLAASGVPTPRTVIVQKDRLLQVDQQLGYPVVLKIPDGAFSLGVHKAGNRDELEAIGQRLLEHSELILAQEYLYTDYDWRIGILNRQPLYACQYFMSGSHWQIVKYGARGGVSEGGSRAVAIDQAPDDVVQTALRAANLIGDGLYGVDVKQNDSGVFVIEVNDNPSIDGGVEDATLGNGLYLAILEEFVRRLNRNKWR
ncbi:MAG TPA: RimK family protein [Gammaproteobacteria bacterium]|nr:RimK family protein [Gammaproteobacteria bacterium]